MKPLRALFRGLRPFLFPSLLAAALACAPSRSHLLHDYAALAKGSDFVRAVIEIPAGTNAKWEVDKESGQLRWEERKGTRRVVQYLAYPGNYGMIPRTALPHAEGGDGDPLDILVLGSALERGAVLDVRLIGVLHLVDEGERDDKILAVPSSGPFSDLREIEQLSERYPGSLQILETWFTHYKGAGHARSNGFGGRQVAREILDAAMSAYRRTLDDTGTVTP